MQALEVIIPGEFYDSQIYDGRLYLWGIDGSLLLVNWDSLVAKIPIPEELKVALQFALQYGDDLYSNILMQDAEIEKLIKSKLQKLSELKVEIDRSFLDECTIGKQDSPLPFPHADSAIHYKKILVGGQSGVSSTNCNLGLGRRPQIETAIKLFDMPVLSISASHQTLALAAGSEGLFEYSLSPNPASRRHNEPHSLSNQHCNLVRWLYPSIFGSSYFNDGYFADFRKRKKDGISNERDRTDYERRERSEPETFQVNFSELVEDNVVEDDENQQERNRYKREFTRVISSKKIFEGEQASLDIEKTKFNDRIFTWGVEDKICLATRDSIELVKYLPKFQANSRKFERLGSVNIQELTHEVISADSSFFGVILEQEDGLTVITSELETYFFEGEPVNWRVFPKSKNYTNHLHIIYDDALHIHSFNHDYFIDQNTKKLGISTNSNKK